MKHLIIILLTLFVNVSFSQSQIEPEEFIENSEEFFLEIFKEANRLITIDSTIEAISHYKHIAKYSKNKEITNISNYKLDSIWILNKKIFEQNLIGEWRWIWSGTNWGTSNSPKRCNCQKYLKFGVDEIFIIKDGKIKKRYKYKIVKDLSKIGSNYFAIKVKSNKKIWRIRIYQEIENSYYLAERSKDAKYYLSLREEEKSSFCVCGCFEERYEK